MRALRWTTGIAAAPRAKQHSSGSPSRFATRLGAAAYLNQRASALRPVSVSSPSAVTSRTREVLGAPRAARWGPARREPRTCPTRFSSARTPAPPARHLAPWVGMASGCGPAGCTGAPLGLRAAAACVSDSARSPIQRRAHSVGVRRPSAVVKADRRESLDRLVHFLGEGSRDVLGAAASWLVMGHGPRFAAPPHSRASITQRTLSAGNESSVSTRTSASPDCSQVVPADVFLGRGC